MIRCCGCDNASSKIAKGYYSVYGSCVCYIKIKLYVNLCSICVNSGLVCELNNLLSCEAYSFCKHFSG